MYNQNWIELSFFLSLQIMTCTTRIELNLKSLFSNHNLYDKNWIKLKKKFFSSPKYDLYNQRVREKCSPLSKPQSLISRW